MNEKLKDKYIQALQKIDNTTIILDINEYVTYLQYKIYKTIEYAKDNLPERDYMGCLLTDEDVTLNKILEKLLSILKEDK